MNFTTWKNSILKPLIDAIAAKFINFQGQIDDRELISNKSDDATFASPSATSYPTTSAVKTYVDTAVGGVDYSIDLAANVLTLNKDGVAQDTVDLSLYLDDTNLARIVSGTVDVNGIATFTRDDASTFTIDFSGLLDNQTAADVPTAVGTYLTTASDVQAVLDAHEGEIQAINDTEDLAAYFNAQFV